MVTRVTRLTSHTLTESQVILKQSHPVVYYLNSTIFHDMIDINVDSWTKYI
jgi:hypothetical protein